MLRADGGDHRVLAQEHLMGRVRGVGLALSPHGESVLLASVMSSLVPSWPSGPGWFWARVSGMNAACGGTSSCVFGIPSGPSVISGLSGRKGTNTVPPLLTVWS